MDEKYIEKMFWKFDGLRKGYDNFDSNISEQNAFKKVLKMALSNKKDFIEDEINKIFDSMRLKELENKN